MILAAVCVVVGALYFAQDVLIPLALAVLLSFLLTPVVQRLERWGLHRAAAVIVVAVLAFGSLFVLGYVVFNQVVALGHDLPTYKENIKAKLQWLPSPGEDGVITQLRETVQEFNEELARPATTRATTQATQPTTQALQVSPPPIAGAPPPEVAIEPATTQPIATRAGASATGPPIPVTIVPPEPSPLDILRDNIGVVAGPLGTAGIVAVFVIFMLLAREDMRNRLIRLVGYGQLTVTTQALDDAGQRISRYLLAQAIVNGTYGAAISIGLWIIGRTFGEGDPSFPNVVLWGLLCAVLRFIPYVGPWIAAAFPLALSLAVYKGFGVFIATGIMFVVIEVLSNNVMEPLLYGSSTGMSTMAIIVSAVFWTWLWGPIGLLLATPMTVCLVVLGKYVPQLQFLDILLGDEPVLEPHQRLYQRWLALDHEEAAELVGEFFQTRSLEDTYDKVLLPALALAEHDRHSGRLDEERQNMIRQSMRELIDELGDDYRLRFARTGATTGDVPGVATASDAGAAGDHDNPRRVALNKECAINVLVLPAHDEADEIVGLMLGQLLEFNNYCATVATHQSLAGEMLDMVTGQNADAVCVSALPPAAVSHSRYLCKRLHQRYPELKMVVGLWTIRGDLKRSKKRISCEDSVLLVTTLADAFDQVEQIIKPSVVRQMEARAGETPLATTTRME